MNAVAEGGSAGAGGAEDLYYERSGAGEPLLLIHGTGSYLRSWDPIVPLLSRDFDVFAVDLPGFGNSMDKAEWITDFDSLVDVLEWFMREHGLERPHLVGNSVGGWLALELAKRGRAASVTAISPCGLWRKGAPLYVKAMYRSSRRLGRALRPWGPFLSKFTICRTVTLFPAFGRPWAVPGERSWPDLAHMLEAPGVDRAATAIDDRRFTGGDAIDVPVTVAFGRRDVALLPHHRRRDQLPPQAHWQRLPRCGHVPMYDDPELVTRTIRETAVSARAQTQPTAAAEAEA